MAMSGGKDDGEPMMEMNTTPLIDVMLVLLIMFIITIPIATHAVNIPLPVSQDTQNDPPVDPIKNKLIIDTNSQLLWNGETIDQPALQRLLAQTLEMSVEPELQFQPEPRARYDLVAETLRTIENSGVNKFGFVGNEQYRNFSSPPVPGA
ncbi:biopolymer transporter ExbD [Sphingorhabdus sp. Alg239-R122]|uniref:ExbD/TolR family protein n=1 Tax=Sphingorhabdus sp. Alg239-R122 TaxID=2305989 RepID=UPI0013D8F0E6|nr:biopolymer transporter ExbD [Sphingorhabdus sp. Alg239-R122]